MKTFIEHLTDTLEHETILGLDASDTWPYWKECIVLYKQFEDEIWDALRMDAEDNGFENCVAFASSFISECDSVIDLETALFRWMAEREAQRYADACEHDEVA